MSRFKFLPFSSNSAKHQFTFMQLSCQTRSRMSLLVSKPSSYKVYHHRQSSMLHFTCMNMILHGLIPKTRWNLDSPSIPSRPKASTNPGNRPSPASMLLISSRCVVSTFFSGFGPLHDRYRLFVLHRSSHDVFRTPKLIKRLGCEARLLDNYPFVSLDFICAVAIST